MKKSELLRLWETAASMAPQQDYRVVRFDQHCKPDVFVAIGPDDSRCLILRSPSSPLRPIEKLKLHLRFDGSIPGVVLKLADDDYQDLFDDLVVSLYGAIKSIHEVEGEQEAFLRHFRKWVALFETEYSSSLDEQTVMGLIGELHVLKRLISSSTDSELSEILSSWRGPYDETQDFVLEDMHVEVKTVTARGTSVTINSLTQLNEEHGKGLELLVNTVSADCDNGVCLSHIFQDVVDQSVERGGDSAILYEAIAQKGLSSRNITDYDHWKYRFHTEKAYDVLGGGFPRLTGSNVSTAITRASYTLSLAGIEPFLLREVDL